ncbi:sugar transferase [Pseudonocardia tropica]|uniref:Sugar transferase n=1 Tax=Pseudonocardia tropica TaxID=681289 RepID=A0ABV1JXI6_9PSEU
MSTDADTRTSAEPGTGSAVHLTGAPGRGRTRPRRYLRPLPSHRRPGTHPAPGPATTGATDNRATDAPATDASGNTARPGATPGPPAPAPVTTRRRPLPAPLRRLGERVSLVRCALVGVDLAVLVLVSALVAEVTPATVATAALVVVVRAAAGLHRPRLRLSWFDDLPRELVAVAVALGLFPAVAMLTNATLGTSEDTPDAVAVVLAAAVGSVAARAVILLVIRTLRVRWGVGEPTLIVGTGVRAVELDETMRAHPEYGMRPIGHITYEDLDLVRVPERATLSARIRTAARAHGARAVVLACHGADDGGVLDAAIGARRDGLAVYLLPWLPELVHDRDGVERIRSIPLLRVPQDPMRRPSWRVKRFSDIVISAVALTVTAPLLAVVAAAVLIESGRPLIFRQERVGLDNRPFTVLKFRSMRPDDEAEQRTRWSIAGDPRVGPVGRLIRRTSLDELPQLWNILRGDMSLVGPRPERPSFVERFSAEHERYTARHRVPVGLTGLAQISGLRGDTSIADRVRHDNYYIANWSLWLDVQILVRTAREVLRGGQH